jgi:hypothetical protein
MPLFNTSANVRRDKTRTVVGAALQIGFSLMNSTRVEKVIQKTKADSQARLKAKGMAAIGCELSERGQAARQGGVCVRF